MSTIPGRPAEPAAVPPSALARTVLRPLTKLLNPLIRKLAGRPHVGFAALVSHSGRRSGRSYLTPVSARLAGDSLVIALTFGSQSDWARNVLAAGGASVRLRGRDYAATAPEILGWAEAGPFVPGAFRAPERAFLRLLGIRQFMRLRISPDPARLEQQPAVTQPIAESERS